MFSVANCDVQLASYSTGSKGLLFKRPTCDPIHEIPSSSEDLRFAAKMVKALAQSETLPYVGREGRHDMKYEWNRYNSIKSSDRKNERKRKSEGTLI